MEREVKALSATASPKPAYRVLSVADIRAAPRNGLVAVSTFSGCGGSCLGLEMAGFRVLWASEFIPAAAEVYRLNHPEVTLDTRDIREVKPEDVLSAAGRGAGEVDLMEGSPPCASFSMSGKREKGWGKVRRYSDAAQRVDDLFFEFIRLLSGIQPRVFFAENVPGLVRGVAKGVFKRVLAALRGAAPGYRVAARILDAQWLGVPQVRRRLFFVGVRADLAADPPFPEPLPWRYSLREALRGLPGYRDGSGPGLRIVHDTRSRNPGYLSYSKGDVTDQPSPPITVGAGGMNSEHFKVTGGASIGRFAIGAEAARMNPGDKSKRYFNLVRARPEVPVPTVTAVGGNSGCASVIHPTEPRKFSIAELKRVCGFPDDFQLSGTYEQQWERLGRAVPPPVAFAVARELRDRVLLMVARGAAL